MADGLIVRDADGVLRLDNFTLMVAPGEIVAVAGVEGNGQSELGAVLSGMLRPTEGRFFICGNEMTGRPPRALTAAGCGVVPEDRHALACVTGMSVAENLMLDRLEHFRRRGLLDRGALNTAARELMQRFDVRAASPDVAFGGLSGGNQQKAVLARELTLDPLRFLLASQPTRGLDVGAVEAIYGHVRAVAARGVGVLLISSELDELLSVADRVVVLYRGRIVGTCKAAASERPRIGAWMAGQTEQRAHEEAHA
jgi:simple sugar transport system ATP-binding protein